MAGVYREKSCPTCKTKHRKRGDYCCQSCASSARTLSETTKDKISEGMREYYQTPEGSAQAFINNRRVNALRVNEAPPVTIEEFTVDIPTIYEIPDGYMTDF